MEYEQGLELVNDDSDVEVIETSDYSFNGEQLVGHGSPANSSCGVYHKFYACLRTDLHDRIRLDGESYKGKVFVKAVRFSCDKPSCPICYKFGWAVREAGKIELRLAEAAAKFGKVEHIVATVPPKFYGLSFKGLRKKILGVLTARKIVGGVLIFHGFRYNKRHNWYWSPHFHVLGFISGGYGECRRCPHGKCFKGCGGWEDLKYRAFEKDGCIVRVLGERKTVGGTAWYQLNHASVQIGVKRYHVATWFGVCSYRKLKVSVEVSRRWAESKKVVCPICQHDLVRVRYCGSKRVLGGIVPFGWRKGVFADFEEDGRPAWVEVMDKFDGG